MTNVSRFMKMRLSAVTSKFIVLLLLFCAGRAGVSQSLYPVSLDTKISRSTLVVEGRVLSQQCFRNPQHTAIFTSSKIEVYKIFKGSLSEDTIEIMTQGGAIDNEWESVSELLQLHKGEAGVFFCFPNQLHLVSPASSRVLYDVYSSAQGVFKYNLRDLTANAPFVRYKTIENDLYTTLKQATGRNFVNRKASVRFSGVAARPSVVNAVSITSFSPSTVNAGATLDPANNVLTISGSGFGTASGSAGVYFDDPDDGPLGNYHFVAYNDPLMISWSATSIQVKVPTNAGTGIFYVSDDAGSSSPSPSALNVLYAVIAFEYATTPHVTKESNLINQNGSGGYTVVYSNSTAGSGKDITGTPDQAAFQRAMTTWKEGVGLNYIENPTPTSSQAVAGDGVNIIMFDNTNTGKPPLPDGVLGITYSGGGICGTTVEAQNTGFDMIFRNAGVSVGSYTFDNGTCPPASVNFNYFDLETVALHELGHSLGLMHIIDGLEGSFLPAINPGKLMNFTVANGVKRNSPDYSAYQGALYLTNPQGNSYGCIVSEMTRLAITTETKDECPVSFPAGALASGTTVSYDLVHATSDKFTDPQYTALNCAGTGTGVTNTAYYAFKSAAAGTLSLTVSGYATTPAAQAACSVAGVELALYQVSACPGGQSYPAPVACATFNANGVVNLNGLAAGTSYLLVADGIDNTKASFSMTFAGAALPVKLHSFTGAAFNNYNQLYWVFDQYYNVQQIDIEKSGDGQTFSAIGSIPAAAVSLNGVFKDEQPYTTDNYYRLAIVNLDGTKEYTNIVLLKRKDDLLVSAWPNPAQDRLNVELSGITPGRYSFVLYNNMGQAVQRTAATLGGYKQTVPLHLGGLPGGLYHLSVYNAKGVSLSELKITVK